MATHNSLGWSSSLHIFLNYRQTSNISHPLVGNNVVDHPDVAGAPPVGAAPTTSSFSTKHLASTE